MLCGIIFLIVDNLDIFLRMGTKIGGKYLDPLTSASVSIAEKSVVFCASRVTKREVDGTFVLNLYPLIQAFRWNQISFIRVFSFAL